MTARKLIGKIHLWLGLTSGLVVFVIAITGCIYAFQEEIQDATQPYRFVTPQDKPLLPPSKIREIADRELSGKLIHAVLYREPGRAVTAIYYMDEQYYDLVYINGYTGEVLQVKDEMRSFFRFILDGHFYLWLPHEIGQPVVASASLVFLVMIISGLILWWPRNRNGRRQRFSVKRNARWRRRNYDLHNVLGFYVLLVALVFAVTGLVWGFQWFRDGVYAVSGGGTFREYSQPLSVPAAAGSTIPAIDGVWLKMRETYPQAGWIEVHPPVDSLSSIAANANPHPSTYWQTDYRYFDQYTLKELPVYHTWGRFGEASGADKLMRMNYDIHVGAIWGLPGKILAFSASLIIASLPVTGFLIWMGRRRKVRETKQELAVSA